MRSIRQLVAALALILLAASWSWAAEPKPVKPKSSDKCPVCGMFAAKYTHWLSEIVFQDGSYAVFDGPKDMFKYYLNLKKYAPSKNPSDIAAIYVTEYYSAKLTEARNLLFVTGSDVYGPMGDELVPLSTEAKAREFMTDHKGVKLLRFPEVTAEHLH